MIIAAILKFPVVHKTGAGQAVKVLLKTKGYNKETMIYKCRLLKYDFVMPSSFDNILKAMSDIYNYRTKDNTKRIDFGNYMESRHRFKNRNINQYNLNHIQSGKSVKTLK